MAPAPHPEEVYRPTEVSGHKVSAFFAQSQAPDAECLLHLARAAPPTTLRDSGDSLAHALADEEGVIPRPREPDRFESTHDGGVSTPLPIVVAPSDPSAHAQGQGTQPSGGRAFLSVYFRCSAQYVRAYKNAAGNAYEARCPACAKPVRFAIGPGGSSERAFTMSCT